MNVCETVIVSRQNKQVVLLGKLGERKHRAKEGLFRFDGKKLFLEAAFCGLDVRQIFLRESESMGLLSLVREKEETLPKTTVYVLADDVFDKLSEERAPEGILSVAAFPPIHTGGEMLAKYAEDAQKRVFLVESVRDPGNVGTILRSAAAFGVDLLVMSRDCADLYNPKTVRGAMGALFRQRICVVDDLPTAISVLRKHGRRVLAATLEETSVSIADVNVSRRDCLVVGNEGHGLSAETVRACSGSIIIPMQEGSESLNAGVAASVLMWEQYRGEQK